MNDLELAEEIERALREKRNYPISIEKDEGQQIIAALRNAALAQTEIKGHMRVEDELKLRIAELEKELRELRSVAS